MQKYEGDHDPFDEYRITEQIEKALDRKVWLPSGGSLVIDRTEAMTVVDVNTGKFVGSGGNLEETVTKNNLEAAEEIVRQLRLRDIGGIIVVDFIDMVLESNRDLVLRRLVECLSRDRTKHQVAEVTSLGLVQMTRKRLGLGLLETFSENCDVCAGRGVIVHHDPVVEAPRRRLGQRQRLLPRRSRRSRGRALRLRRRRAARPERRPQHAVDPHGHARHHGGREQGPREHRREDRAPRPPRRDAGRRAVRARRGAGRAACARGDHRVVRRGRDRAGGCPGRAHRLPRAAPLLARRPPRLAPLPGRHDPRRRPRRIRDRADPGALRGRPGDHGRRRADADVAILDIPVPPVARSRQKLDPVDAEQLLGSVLEALPEPPAPGTRKRASRRVSSGTISTAGSEQQG